MKKGLLLLILIAVIAAGIYAYGKINQNPAGPVKITFPYALGSTSELIGDIMKFYKIDTKHGLEVTFVGANPGDLERQEFDGTIKGLLIMSPISAMDSTLKGRPMKILSPVTYMPYIVAVRSDSTIKNLEDLSGKKVGIIPKAVGAYDSLDIIFKSVGIDPEKSFSLTFGSIPEMVNLLAKGQVDAAVVTYPNAAALFSSGQFRSIANLEDIWEKNENGLPHAFIVTTAFDDWYQIPANRDAAKRFFEAYFETIALMRSNPEVITEDANPGIAAYLKANNLTTDASKELLREKITSFLPKSWDTQTTSAINLLLKRAQEAGYLPNQTLPDIIVGQGQL
ncbi:MAG TPA: ABC transporter substrate-binding protein [Candidatus Paceibacterota bacterium]